MSHMKNCAFSVGVYCSVMHPSLASGTVIVTVDSGESPRFAALPSLYLNSFGETDRQFRGGKALFLSQERLQWVREMVLRHNFVHDSSVLRTLRKANLFHFFVG